MIFTLVGCTSAEYKKQIELAEAASEAHDYDSAAQSYEAALAEKPDETAIRDKIEEMKLLKTDMQKEALSTYYQAVIDGNAQSAYDTLSTSTKSNVTLEQYSEFLSTMREVSLLKSFRVEKQESNENTFDIVETAESLYDSKELSNTYQATVVWENNKWMYDRPDFDVKQRISDNYVTIGYLYFEGRAGKTLNYYDGIDACSKATEYSERNAQAFFCLGYGYSKVENYDSSITAYEQTLKFMTPEQMEDKSFKSLLFSNLGAVYILSGDIAEGKSSIEASLQLDPNNARAKSMLAALGE